ncbi:glucosyltransferase domain-containing protein [Yersinia rochesterensis]|uniref:glucosyltransferase domain-containing protein n=1 Tax=Yersinia TaxID=629 RepID=UPI0022406687|nr:MULTISPECIES: glucosyltransferase domain-containing protein [Yersinia]MDA5542779.1 glucosyltransferase domain-containing protein [Yersinia rochesterensis]UZM76640.1 glucosyltransferase domain-containing protein [Yersinia sp. SCPM-O-B-9106 (C-191)]
MNFKFDSGSKIILLLTILFALPILMNGIYYQDDILRSLTGVDGSWNDRGRLLSTAVLVALGFGGDFLVNLFPFTYIIAVIVLAMSSIILYNRFAIERSILSGVAFSLFSLNPFLLQNLSYQFDSLPMMLSIFFATVPFSVYFTEKKIHHRMILTIACLIISLSLYQIAINIFISLSAIEIIHSIYKSNYSTASIKRALEKVFLLIVSMLIYLKSITPFLSQTIPTKIIENTAYFHINLNKYLEILNPLDTNPFHMAWGIPIILSCIALALMVYKIIINNNKFSMRFYLISLIALSFIIVIFSIFGPFILIQNTVVQPRVMMGLSGLMVLVAFLCSTIKTRFPIAILLIPPVVLSLSISSAFGNASKSQRNLEDKVFFDIANNIPESWKSGDIYVYGQISTTQAAKMEIKRFPIIKRLTVPLYDWTGMLMLGHYDVRSRIDNPNSFNKYRGDIIIDKNNYTLEHGKRNIVILK